MPVAFGDPFILSVSDGKYYMYGTGDERVVFIDELKIDEKGVFSVDGPSTSEKEL